MPDSINNFGVIKEPADKIISFSANNFNVFPDLFLYSMPITYLFL